MEGVLYKKGRGRNVSFIKPWSLRYFQLNAETNTLSYFVESNGTRNLRGEIKLSKGLRATPVLRSVSGRPHSFVLSGVRSFDTLESDVILAAADDNERDLWVAALNDHISSYTEIEPVETTKVSFDEAPAAAELTTNVPFATPSETYAYQPRDGEIPVLTSPPLPQIAGAPTDGDAAANYYSSTEQSSAVVDDSDSQMWMDPKYVHLLLSSDDFLIDTDSPPAGTGGYGVVYKATRKRDGKLLAVKFFGYAKRDPATISVWDEIDVMLTLKGNDAFVQLEGCFKDTEDGILPRKNFPGRYPVIVMEFVDHDLLSYLAGDTSAESILPSVFRGLVEGLRCLHEKKLIHRDLKVDNIMISADRKVKLIDFGLLVRLPPGKSEYQGSQTGTIGYFAPESIPLSGRAKFSPKSDIWQAGVVLYVLLSGSLPFNISSVNIRKGKYAPLTGSQWESRSEEAKDLIRRLLVVNPVERLSCDDILSHPWLAASAPVEVFNREYYQRISSLAVRRKVKRVLEEMRNNGSEGDAAYEREAHAEAIHNCVQLTSDERYFNLRTGALKSWLLQHLRGDYTYCSELTYDAYAELMVEHKLPELETRTVFDCFLGATAELSREGNSPPANVLSVKELILTLMSLCLMDDQDNDVFVTFLKFDLNGDGYLSREEMGMIFRSILEEEALKSMRKNDMVGDGGEHSNGRDSLVDIDAEMMAIDDVLESLAVNHPKGIEFAEFKNFFDTAMKISTCMSRRVSMNMTVRMSMRLMSAAKSAKISVSRRKPQKTQLQKSL